MTCITPDYTLISTRRPTLSRGSFPTLGVLMLVGFVAIVTAHAVRDLGQPRLGGEQHVSGIAEQAAVVQSAQFPVASSTGPVG